MNFKQAIIIAMGGSLGALSRGWMNKLLPFSPESFSWGTFSVNMIGCFLIGVLWTRLDSETQKLFWITGVLGGFTTFSGFGLELLRYMDQKEFMLCLVYGLSSVILGIFTVWAGQKLAA